MSYCGAVAAGKKDVTKDPYVKRAGPYLLGPALDNSPVKSITHCLAREDGTDNFYSVKILTVKGKGEKETTDDIQGKILIHTEYTLLKVLQNMKGVVQQHGLYEDYAEIEEEKEVDGQKITVTRNQKRICLVLDCYSPHDFCPKYTNLANLQHYVIREKRLPESVAMKIFYNVVQIVDGLHKQNIVHRDLKLGNIVFNKETFEVTISNFCLGRLLTQEDEKLKDQRGSPAYISPDVICGKPYLGKPSDMWALGVVLYTMLYGQFPFYDSSPSELFRKIKLAEFQIPVTEYLVSSRAVSLVKSLLTLDPMARPTASQILKTVEENIKLDQGLLSNSDLQVVPEMTVDDDVPQRSYRGKRVYPDSSSFNSFEMMLNQSEKSENAVTLGGSLSTMEDPAFRKKMVRSNSGESLGVSEESETNIDGVGEGNQEFSRNHGPSSPAFQPKSRSVGFVPVKSVMPCNNQLTSLKARGSSSVSKHESNNSGARARKYIKAVRKNSGLRRKHVNASAKKSNNGSSVMCTDIDEQQVSPSSNNTVISRC